MIAEDETKVFYGTPLAVDDDEEEAPRKKPVPIEQQEVRDERGIRRFHGAFTGGFSAGYFNTVGSKEGWAPSNFLSSRETRAEKQGQSRPEDYMDSEDLGVFGIAPRAIKVNKDFDEEKKKGNSSSKKRQFQFNDGPIPGVAPLKDLIVPSRESAGVKLLRKMGWKPGQGIGPRVKRKSKTKEKEEESSPARVTQEPGVKVYGCFLPENFSVNENSDDEDDYELLKGITFAPDDVEVLAYKAKDDFHGIGYKGLDRNPILATFRSRKEIAPPPVRDKKKKLAIAGEAFGVGAFEEDDDNIYMVDDMSQYDFELGGSSSKSDKRNTKGDSKKVIGYIGEVLEGFHLSSKPPPTKKRYPPPTLPKDFQPFYNKTTKKVEPQPSAAEKKEVAVFDRHRLTATERAEVIGSEKQVGSVFELMRPEDRARLRAIQKGAPATPIVIGGPLSTSTVDRKGGFQPFGRDPDKQKRYDLYQKFKQNNKEDAFSKCQPSTMTEWEKQREVEEFRQAAAIYKPLAHSMAMRFTTAKHGDTEIIPAEKSKPSDAVESKPVEKLKYGSGTRARIEWHPDRLLCRRFNVPDPYPESTMVGVYKIKKDRFSIFDILNGNQSRPAPNLPDDNSDTELPDSPVGTELTATSTEPSEEPQKVVRPNLFAALDDIGTAPSKPVASSSTSNVTQIETTKKTDENSEEKRPPMDLFKAIFEDTESESEKESEGDDEEEKEAEVQKPAQENSKKISVADVLAQSSLSSLDKSDKTKQLGGPRLASGVFANLDLDSPNLASTSESRRIVSVAVKGKTKPAATEDSYGPVLPPHLRQTYESNDTEYGPRLPTTKTNSDFSKNGKVRISKHHKEKHKHKKKSKKKHRSKHKRRKDSESSEESSSDSDSPVDAVNLNKLLKSRLKSLKKPIIFD